MVTMTLSILNFSSCKKDSAVETPTSLVGTTWVSTNTELKSTLNFTSETDVTQTNEGFDPVENTYTYSDSKGTITVAETLTADFSVNGNTLIWGLLIYTKQ